MAIQGGILPLKQRIIALKYWIRLISLPKNWYLRIVYNSLASLDFNVETNWCSRISSLLFWTNHRDVLENQKIPLEQRTCQRCTSNSVDDEGGGPRVVVSTAAFHARVRGSVPGLGGLKETKLFLPHPRVKVSIVGSLRDREVACSASDRQCSNFEFCVWRTVSSQSSHHPQEVLLAQFSLYVHKGGLKPDSFHFVDDEIHFLFTCSYFATQRTTCWKQTTQHWIWFTLKQRQMYIHYVMDG